MSRAASDPTTRSAAPKSSVRVIGPGTATTAMPAARPAATPFGESSRTTQRAGSAPSARAASRNRSGAGLVRELSPPTSSRVTTDRNRGRRPRRSRCGTTHSDADDEATAAGTPAASAASSSPATPSQGANASMSGSRRASRRATSAARSTGRPSWVASCSVQCGWSAVPRIECHHASSSGSPCSAKISTTASYVQVSVSRISPSKSKINPSGRAEASLTATAARGGRRPRRTGRRPARRSCGRRPRRRRSGRARERWPRSPDRSPRRRAERPRGPRRRGSW